MAMKEWVRLPTDWIIRDGRLDQFRWRPAPEGSDNAAALISLAAIAHHADEDGVSKVTYDSIAAATGLSRAKVSGGLAVLERLGIVERRVNGRRSTYRLSNYDPRRGWGKLPAKGLYRGERIPTFEQFHLRRPSELNALKLYFLFVAVRNNETNMAHIGYEKIEEYTRVGHNNIRTALSLLAALGLVHIEHIPSTESPFGVANAYRLAHLDTFNHMGTRGRSMRGSELADLIGEPRSHDGAWGGGRPPKAP